MKFFLDSADVDEVREINAWGVLAGVTTNPSLVAKQGGDFIANVHEICEIVGGPVSAEVVAADADGMVEEGKALASVHEHVVVKVPLTPVGLEAVSRLSAEGIKTNVTLCFQPAQALLAARAGASYISPFIGRLDDISDFGNQLIANIAEVYAQAGDIHTQVLAASIRHPMHLVEAALAGADVATVPYAVFKKLLNHPLTDAGNQRFADDWAKVSEGNILEAVARFKAKQG